MRRLLPTLGLGTMLAAFGVVHLAAQTADPLVGTWAQYREVEVQPRSRAQEPDANLRRRRTGH